MLRENVAIFCSRQCSHDMRQTFLCSFRFFSHTNPYISNVTQQCRCSLMLIFRAWATCAQTRNNHPEIGARYAGKMVISSIRLLNPKALYGETPPQGEILSLPQFFTEKVPLQLIFVNYKTRHFFPGGGGGGRTWVNFCFVCAAGLSEPPPKYSLFCDQL